MNLDALVIALPLGLAAGMLIFIWLTRPTGPWP